MGVWVYLSFQLCGSSNRELLPPPNRKLSAKSSPLCEPSRSSHYLCQVWSQYTAIDRCCDLVETLKCCWPRGLGCLQERNQCRHLASSTCPFLLAFGSRLVASLRLPSLMEDFSGEHGRMGVNIRLCLLFPTWFEWWVRLCTVLLLVLPVSLHSRPSWHCVLALQFLKISLFVFF